jgi:predicted cupin superfamily sugar epimerase
LGSVKQIVESLDLEPHPEGGYFRRTYASKTIAPIGPNQSDRPTLTCIYYLLTHDSPIGHLHVNRSDIVHFFQGGSPINYTLVSPQGELETVILGTDIAAGQKLQFTVPGGWWKASQLIKGDYGLISEAVSPGFAFEDMAFVTEDDIVSRFPELNNRLNRFIQKQW